MSLKHNHESAPVWELVGALQDEHQIPSQVSEQVMSWFGEIQHGRWAMNVDAVLKQVGIGILRNYKVHLNDKCSLS